jgi:NAD(P)-dependent dehydrogenase (short-subunit alcohol dehydrogenase family)
MPLSASQHATLISHTLTNEAKTAVIVGGTSGIGAATARRFAKNGCQRIVIVGRNEGRAQQVIKLLKTLSPDVVKEGFEGVFVKGDVS